MRRATFLILAALGVGAQTPAPTPAPAAPAPAAAQAPAPAPAPQPKPEDVVLARVGGEAITEADFQAAFRMLGQQEQMQVLMVQGGKEEFVRRMAESRLLSVKARRLGLEKTPEFQRALARTTEDLLAREYLNREGAALQKKLGVEEAQVKAYYDAHQDQFRQPELVSVRHILISVKQGEGQEGLTDAEAKAKIATLQAELKKKGASFEALAKKHSDDPGSKENGGLYADADPTAWVPEFAAAARTQPVGKVGAPVKTQFGYHLIKVEERKAARQIPFDEAKPQAQRAALMERQTAVWNELMDSLRKEIPFELVKPAAPAPAPAPAAPAKGGAQ